MIELFESEDSSTEGDTFSFCVSSAMLALLAVIVKALRRCVVDLRRCGLFVRLGT